jgi:hypothetical protein
VNDIHKVKNNKTLNIFSFHFAFLIDQSQSSARELKNENHFLKDYIHRLNAAASEYQTLHPPDSLKKDTNVRSRIV